LGHPTKKDVSNFSFEAYIFFSGVKDIISQCLRNISRGAKMISRRKSLLI